MIRKKESSSSTEIKSILAEGLRIEGNVLSEGKIRIDGEINGDIKGDYIILGETSKIKGNILSEFIVIMGTVEGNISSQEVEIKTTGKIRGDIVTQKLSIEPGASIEGTLRSGDFYEKNVSIFSIETVE
jgi:cytoskeletal protein CcmA (bactofilin family)